jgi:hypothetical protein
VFPPCGLSEAEEERIELALCARSSDLFAETGLFVPCAVLDATARATEPSSYGQKTRTRPDRRDTA